MTSSKVEGFLLDMEGVLVRHGEPIAGSVEALVRLRAVGIPFRILTNSSRLSVAGLSAWLGERGFSVDPEEIWNGPRVAAHALRSSSCSKRLALATPEVIENDLPGFEALDASPSREKVEDTLVLVTDAGECATTARLGAALDHVIRGAALYSITRSAWYRGDGERCIPDDGFYLAGLEAAVGRRGIALGKPSADAFHCAVTDLALPADSRIVMVGDTFSVDVAGAREIGLDTVFIHPGEGPVADNSGLTFPDLSAYLYKLLRIR